MVAKGTRKKQVPMTAYERGLLALSKVPVSDEDPSVFWGPNWREEFQQESEDIAAGKGITFDSLEDMFAFLETVPSACQPSTPHPASSKTSRRSHPAKRQRSE